MASAVLASRNEPDWGERKVYMRKYTNSTNNSHLSKFNPSLCPKPSPISNSNPNPGRLIHDSSSKSYVWKSEEPSPRSAPPPDAANDSSLRNRMVISLNDRKESSHGGYVTFDLAAYSRRELKELKRRLISELEQVRSLMCRIEAREVESRSARVSQFSGGYGGGREVIRPPPLQLNHALDSPGAVAASKEKRTPKASQQYLPSEFVTGKNKMMPPAGNKITGNKRALPYSTGKDPKRTAVFDSQVAKLVTSIMRRCSQILTKLMKHKYSWVFNTPVDAVALGLHDYHEVIKHPMDLGSVKSRLDKNEYGSPLEFAFDVRLTFKNAMTYNPKGQDVYAMAEALLSLFEEMFTPAYNKFEGEHRRVIVAEQVNNKIFAPPLTVMPEFAGPLTDPVLIANGSNSIGVQSKLSDVHPLQLQRRTAPPSVPAALATNAVVAPKSSLKLPKPKAKDPNKRQMSFEEKAKLGMNLQNIPSEKMDQLLHIIKRRNSYLAQEGDEIELDIEALDNETLWELDRFVSYHKKAVSKIKRQGLISNSISAVQINKSPVIEPIAEEATQKNKKGGDVIVGEEDVDIGEELPVNNFPPVEIDKDAAYDSSRSSSSSSSSSGSDDSSSSDSDSGSSSGSGSDAGSVHSPCVQSKEAPVT